MRGGGGETPYALLSPEEVVIYKYKNKPGEWTKIYMIAKDPKGCAEYGTGATTRKITMTLEVPFGFEIRYSTEKTIFHRESGSNRIWVDFTEVFQEHWCSYSDREGYYARDWFEIRPLPNVEEGTYILKMNWFADYIDANGMSQTISGESNLKIDVEELTPPELISSASDLIDAAEKAIASAEAYVTAHTIEADMSAAMLLLNNAKDYLDDAKYYFANEEFELSKSKASKAKKLAEQAEDYARNAVKKAEEERIRKEKEAEERGRLIIGGLISIAIIFVSAALIYKKKKKSEKEKVQKPE